MKNPPWQFDETDHTGKDFACPEVVDAYDAMHGQFRDIETECGIIMSGLGLDAQHRLADIGCGTGAFAVHAAQRCATVYAVDISPAMLKAVEWKASRQGITNIVVCQGGFLTFDPPGGLLDAVSSSLALHHLPDFWKQKALRRVSNMLKDGGRFHMMDVVFSPDDPEVRIAEWIGTMRQTAGNEVADDISRHVRQEFSTFTWVMEDMLERAGFRIDHARPEQGVLARYFCTKA